MHAVVVERNGGPEVLDYKEVPDPAPRDGQVLVDVEAVGVNFRDVYEREGRDYGSRPPAIIGVEGAGTVVATGERVAGSTLWRATRSGWRPIATSWSPSPKASLL